MLQIWIPSSSQSLFKFIQRLPYFDQDKFIRDILINVRHIPIEYRTIFFDQLFHIADDFLAMSLQFNLFNSRHFIHSVMFRERDAATDPSSVPRLCPAVFQ